MHNTIKKLVGIAITVLIVASGYIFYTQKSALPDVIKLGFVGPLTGEAAVVGLNAKIAAEIAVDEINSAGGIDGKRVELISEDGKCNGKDAASAASKLITVDKVVAIVGGMCSSETLAFADLAEKNRIPVISYGSSNPSIANSGDYIFRDYVSDTLQGKVAAEYTYDTLGKKKVAILYVNIDWGNGIKEVFKKRFAELGGTIVAEEGFTQGSRDLRSQLIKIKQADPEVIYLLGYADDAVVALKQIKEADIRASILGGDAWDDPKTLAGAGSAREGIMYIASSMALSDAFKAKMSARTGNNGVSVAVPQAYDAVNIFASAIKDSGTKADAIKTYLYNLRGYQGVSGKIEFDANGDLATPNMVVKVIRNGKAEELK